MKKGALKKTTRRRKVKGKFIQKQVVVSKKKKVKKKKVSPFAKFIPKKTKFLRAHKIKTPLIDWKNKVTEPLYNGCSLVVLRVVRLNEKHMEIFRLRLVRELNKKIATDRKRFKIIRDRVWSRINTSVPFTKNPIGMRMGKGKGSVCGWRVQVPGGRILIEVASKWRKKALGFGKKITRLLSTPSITKQKLNFSQNRFNVIFCSKKKQKPQHWKKICTLMIRRKLRLKLLRPKLIVFKGKRKVRFMERSKAYKKLN